jgi:hypothetical protein
VMIAMRAIFGGKTRSPSIHRVKTRTSSDRQLSPAADS